ncbi:hypothetical protein RFI_07753 [Reticulomyxa filosa]|uniref:Uncharacterized protein n=1 Tax=Reticulomyxa filosa TaxID=46433 RepID=X6NVT7_RETFI|nr:hypothetical protein RFI_07753 [Reticulomyxa filosa]|eukprot:ETO29367.1 hypothetical protein RFI_07753 [Reticulomyxa filosa]
MNKTVSNLNQTKAKYVVIKFFGDEKTIFQPTGQQKSGKFSKGMRKRNWEELLNTIKEAFHLTTTSSFVLVRKEDSICNGKDFFYLWNKLIENKRVQFYTLKMVCQPTNENKNKKEYICDMKYDSFFFLKKKKEVFGNHERG